MLIRLRRVGGIAVVVETVAVDHERGAQSVEVAGVLCVVDIVLEKHLKQRNVFHYYVI